MPIHNRFLRPRRMAPIVRRRITGTFQSMTRSAAIRAAEAQVDAAYANLRQAENDLHSAQAALNAVQADEVVSRFRTIDWEVLYELGIGGMLVRYETGSDGDALAVNPNLPRRYVEKPGCLVSGEFDRRTPVSDRTMRLLVQSGLARWVERRGHATEMRLTEEGARRVAGMTRPSLQSD